MNLIQRKKTWSWRCPYWLPIEYPLLVHAEIDREPAVSNLDKEPTSLEYVKSRPDRWETEAIDMMIGLCRNITARSYRSM